MTRLRQDVLYALRTFAKSPGFTVLAILVLAVGVGANTAVFSIVNELLLRPLSGRAGEFVGLYSHDRTRPDAFREFSYPNYVDIRDRSDLFDGDRALLAHTFSMVGMPAGDETRRTLAALISSNYFDTLGVRLAAGRTFTADEERPGAGIPVAIATYARWQREQLDPAFIGRTIKVNSQDFTVVGVAPQAFTGTMALVSADVYLPLGVFDAIITDPERSNSKQLADRSNNSLILAGRLKPGLSDARAHNSTRRLVPPARGRVPRREQEPGADYESIVACRYELGAILGHWTAYADRADVVAVRCRTRDCVPECRQHAAGARRGAPQGTGRPPRAWRAKGTDHSPAADRGRPARRRRRRPRPDVELLDDTRAGVFVDDGAAVQRGVQHESRRPRACGDARVCRREARSLSDSGRR